VYKLEYQAYSKLALKTMDNILSLASTSLASEGSAPAQQQQTQSQNQSLILHATVHHRLGTVPVGEPSIVIAVSSPHRREAFIACEWILEQVKKRAQIWKREYYVGEDESTAEWKENY
jgi:molybdopterin synthase catalytic subunit